MKLEGAAVAVIGRFSAAPRTRLAAELARCGAELCARPAKADGIVFGYGAHARIDRVTPVLDDIERRGGWWASERGLLRALGLGEKLPTVVRPLSLTTLAGHAGLGDDIVRLLAAFDIIEGEDGAFEFRDLVALRQVKRLMEAGTSLADIIAAAIAVRRRQPHANVLAGARLTRAGDGELARTIGAYLAELDGQMRLPLDDGGNQPMDLLFEEALQAEEDGRLAEAEAAYRRILAIDWRDPIAHFNLANVLSAARQAGAAEASLRRALALRPDFAEAWYNLAHLLEGRGEIADARQALERAIEADPRFADAFYNLARLHLVAGDADMAEPLFDRYLAFDASSRWAAQARQSLRLCRLLRGGKAG